MATKLESSARSLCFSLEELLARYSRGERNFRGVDLAGADLEEVDLSHADLRGANLAHANLRGANLALADLRKVNLRKANLRVASLSNCDLAGANLTDTDLSHAQLGDTNLFDVTFCRVKCYKTFFTGAILPDGSIWRFRALVSGNLLSRDSLSDRHKKLLKQRKLFLDIAVLVFLFVGFEVSNFFFSFAFPIF